VAATGLQQDLAARLFDAWELPRPQPGQALRADDDELLRLAVPALEGFGGEETALLGAARQRGGRLRGLAESQGGCSTPTSRSAWPPKVTRTIPGATTSTRSPRP
jgi:hypothetical protein